MKKKMLSVLSTAVFFFAVSAVSAWDKTTENELKRVMQRNISAVEKEDIELAVLDLDDSAKAPTRAALKQLFAQYDLKSRIISFKVLSVSGNTAQVEVTQETRKVNGPAFQDNMLTAVHTLIKRSSGWKITATQVKTLKAL